MKSSVIHWFRKGLRLHDNPALLDAVKLGSEKGLVLRPIYIFDPWFDCHAKIGTNRYRFLLQSLKDLDDSLRSLGSRLFILKGNPKVVFEDHFKRWQTKFITWENEGEPYAIQRDEEVKALAASLNISVTTHNSRTLYEADTVISKNKGQVPLTYQKFLGLISAMKPPSKPLESLTAIPESSQISDEDKVSSEYKIPDLKELMSVSESDLPPTNFPGGESEALSRLAKEISMKNTNWVRNFEKPKTSPNSLEPSTTVLSPYLSFGCLSPRTMYWKINDIYAGAKHSQPPVSLHGQLIWREFFYCVGSATPNFDQMKGNKICYQIPWDHDPVKIKAWTEGKTGFPFIDAIMVQLRREGWIHHLARHSVACFLTRGDLWQSWEEGKNVFEELLLDADWFLNAANWMWLSASSFFYQYFRVYSPIAFGKKTDPNGDFIKKYLPQLKKFPPKYIYEPWLAPLSMQKTAGCVIGVDYPKPIVDHSIVSKANIGKMKAAYAVNKGESSTGKRAADDQPKGGKKLR